MQAHPLPSHANTTHMSEIKLRYVVNADDFSTAGEASSDLKDRLKKLGFPSEAVRRAAIALYEGEINLAIHADGGVIDVTVTPHDVQMNLTDEGPGIPDISLAMREGFSTASEEVRNLGFGAGMGLPNMKRHSDNFTIESQVGEGTKITMTVRPAGQ